MPLFIGKWGQASDLLRPPQLYEKLIHNICPFADTNLTFVLEHHIMNGDGGQNFFYFL